MPAPVYLNFEKIVLKLGNIPFPNFLCKGQIVLNSVVYVNDNDN